MSTSETFPPDALIRKPTRPGSGLLPPRFPCFPPERRATLLRRHDPLGDPPFLYRQNRVWERTTSRKLARWYTLQILHLLGYRKKIQVGGRLVVQRQGE